MNPLQLVVIGYGATGLGVFLGIKIPEKWEVRIFSLPFNIGVCLFWILTIVGCLTAVAGVFNALLLVWRLISRSLV